MSQATNYCPEFFEPKPVSYDEQLFVKRKFVIIKRQDIEVTVENKSILGKRKLVEAFGLEIYNDKDRYGQDITSDFFVTNIGHGVI